MKRSNLKYAMAEPKLGAGRREILPAPTPAASGPVELTGKHARVEAASLLASPESADSASPTLTNTKWTVWKRHPALVHAFLAEVRAEQERMSAGAIARVCKKYGVPEFKYWVWKECPPALPEPILELAVAAEPEPQASGPIDGAPAPAASPAIPAPAEPPVLQPPEDHQAEDAAREPPTREERLQNFLRNAQIVTGNPATGRADLLRALCATYCKTLAYPIAAELRPSMPGVSNNLIKKSSVAGLIDATEEFAGTREEFPAFADPFIRRAILERHD